MKTVFYTCMEETLLNAEEEVLYKDWKDTEGESSNGDPFFRGGIFLARLENGKTKDPSSLSIKLRHLDGTAHTRSDIGLSTSYDGHPILAAEEILRQANEYGDPFHVEFLERKDPEGVFKGGLARLSLSALTGTKSVPEFTHPYVGVATICRTDRISTGISVHVEFLDEGWMGFSGTFSKYARVKEEEMDLLAPRVPSELDLEERSSPIRPEFSNGGYESLATQDMFIEKRVFRAICDKSFPYLMNGDKILVRKIRPGECEPIYELGWEEELRDMQGKMIKSRLEILPDGTKEAWDIPIMGYKLVKGVPSGVGYIFDGRNLPTILSGHDSEVFNRGNAFQKILFPGVVNCGYVPHAKIDHHANHEDLIARAT